MSFNLHCKDSHGVEIDLDQTPTQATLFILSDRGDGPDGGWEGVLYRYVSWLELQRQRAFNEASKDPERQADSNLYYKGRVNEIVDAAKSRGPLEFYYL